VVVGCWLRHRAPCSYHAAAMRLPTRKLPEANQERPRSYPESAQKLPTRSSTRSFSEFPPKSRPLPMPPTPPLDAVPFFAPAALDHQPVGSGDCTHTRAKRAS
jgi:hypothetical protein